MTYEEAKTHLVLLGWKHDSGIHWKFPDESWLTIYPEDSVNFAFNYYPTVFDLTDSTHFKTYEEGIDYITQ